MIVIVRYHLVIVTHIYDMTTPDQISMPGLTILCYCSVRHTDGGHQTYGRAELLGCTYIYGELHMKHIHLTMCRYVHSKLPNKLIRCVKLNVAIGSNIPLA